MSISRIISKKKDKTGIIVDYIPTKSHGIIVEYSVKVNGVTIRFYRPIERFKELYDII